jgi:hypothetical protein
MLFLFIYQAIVFELLRALPLLVRPVVKRGA